MLQYVATAMPSGRWLKHTMCFEILWYQKFTVYLWT